MKSFVWTFLVCASSLSAQKAAVVPREFHPASHPDFLTNQRSEDRLAGRFPWAPQLLYYGGPDSVGPLDSDWVWPDTAFVDWNRDGLVDVIRGLSAGTYNHRPRDQRFRTVVYLNTGQRKDNVPIFAEPYQVPLDYPVGSMHFNDIDNDGAMDLIIQNGKVFRWYRDTSKSGDRNFVFQGNLQDFGLKTDLGLLETVSMAPSIQLVDFDGDGEKDLIVGGRGGNNNYYPRKEIGFGKGFASDGSWLGGDRNGSVVMHKFMGKLDGKLWFTTGRRLIAGEDERAISYYDTATAVVTDWDDDGKPDLLVASFDNLFLYRNSGKRLEAGKRIPVAGLSRLPWERVQIMEVNWNEKDRHNLLLQGSSFAWYLPNTGDKGAPRYEKIQALLQKHAPVSGGDFAVPTAGDLNGDGKLDLVIGNEDGYLLYVENTSRGKLPESFALAVELKAGGETFRVETPNALQGPAEGRWGYTSPVLVDWDGDGDLDIVTGSMHEHFLYLENRGTAKKFDFAKARVLTHMGGTTLATVWRTRPVIRDLDGDGLKDLMALNPEGQLVVYRGTRDAKGQFDLGPAERVNEPDGKPVKLDGFGRETGRANLTAMDWDGDGTLDLMVGNAVENFDGLRWYRNTGTAKQWAMQRQPNIPLNLPWNHYHLVEPVDWDGDGKTDIIAGSEGGWIYFYRQQ
ncbi:MAG: VCBS repeat-containing protein [Bryobacteraceae bacterium]|nr:VCBS repeat-containing protein [Bryobacteraceae bacterium]